jgi:hypothetical protein
VVAAKVFAATGAMCLVGGIALAILMRPTVTLADLMAMMDHRMAAVWNRAEHGVTASWFWDHAVMPVLLRPAWLLPTGLGLVCVGAAVSFAWGRESARR